jgi:drug/metabolite transporter (DMT)-like permease
LSYSLFLVISKRLLHRIDALGATATLMALGALGVLAIALPGLARFDPTTVSAATWGLAVFIVVFATAGAYLLNFWALARADSSYVALFIYVQPLIAATLAAAVRGDRVGPREIVGGAAIFLGVFLALPGAGLVGCEGEPGQ